jgi:hypothetical protein
MAALAAGTAVALSGHGGGGGSGADRSPGVAGPSGSPAMQDVRAGVRVPRIGYVTLVAGQVLGYRFTAPAGARLYLRGDTEACADVVPWWVTAPDGHTVARSSMACDTYGPFPLSAGGRYELHVGGADGSFAFQLTLG